MSKVQVDENNIAISAGYDGQLLLWNLDNLSCAQGFLNGHRGPVTKFAWHESLLVSGDRTGILAFWDINRPEQPLKLTKGHG